YPNPFNDQLTVELELFEETEYKIYSILGELLITGVFNDGVNKIDLSSLSQNIYFLKVDNQLIKLIKSK
ncbi:MAG: T9SS type A sorting domain-containing protein, partial [Crocinitomicaceae bacterium]|nr:T9SS type A sorting domain-containing protein [Crocinitomicaceae bacterium]